MDRIHITLYGDECSGEYHSAQNLLEGLGVSYNPNPSYIIWEPPAPSLEARVRSVGDDGEWHERRDCGHWELRCIVAEHMRVGQYLFLWLIMQMSARYTFELSDANWGTKLLSYPPQKSGGFGGMVAPKTFSGVLGWLVHEIVDGWVIPPKSPNGDFLITRKGRRAIERMRLDGRLEKLLLDERWYGPELLGWMQDAIVKQREKDALAA